MFSKGVVYCTVVCKKLLTSEFDINFVVVHELNVSSSDFLFAHIIGLPLYASVAQLVKSWYQYCTVHTGRLMAQEMPWD